MKRIISVLVIITTIFCGLNMFTRPAMAKSSGKVSLKNVSYYHYLFTSKNRKYRKIVKKVAKQALKYHSDYERALFLHDYICTHCSYDYKNYKKKTVPLVDASGYGALINGKAVCSGYANAYKDLCRSVGLKCEYISSRKMNHAWNGVWIDGKKYLVDVTWDDPIGYSKGYVNHQFFLESNKGFGNYHPNKKGYNNKKYDNDPIDRASGEIHRNGSYFYYIQNSGNSDGKASIVRQKIGTLKTETLYSTTTDNWINPCNAGCFRYKDHYIFGMWDSEADASYVYSINLDGNELTKHFKLSYKYSEGVFKRGNKYYEVLKNEKSKDITKKINALRFAEHDFDKDVSAESGTDTIVKNNADDGSDNYHQEEGGAGNPDPKTESDFDQDSTPKYHDDSNDGPQVNTETNDTEGPGQPT